MGAVTNLMSASLLVLFVGVHLHPERPPILDPTQARELFHVAETNRTADGTLTHAQVTNIFAVFDTDGDGEVTGAEFHSTWQTRELGDTASANFLFSRADTDKDGSISEFPDMQRVFTYFDLNGDGQVDELEFIVIWSSLST